MALKVASAIEGRATEPIIPIAADIVEWIKRFGEELISKLFVSVKTKNRLEAES